MPVLFAVTVLAFAPSAQTLQVAGAGLEVIPDGVIPYNGNRATGGFYVSNSGQPDRLIGITSADAEAIRITLYDRVNQTARDVDFVDIPTALSSTDRVFVTFQATGYSFDNSAHSAQFSVHFERAGTRTVELPRMTPTTIPR